MIHTKKWMVVPYESDDETVEMTDDLLKIKNMSDYEKINNFQNNLAKTEQKNYQKDNQIQSIIKKEEIATENNVQNKDKVKKEEDVENLSIIDHALAKIKEEIGELGDSLTEKMRNEFIDMNNTMWSNNSLNERNYNQLAFNNTPASRRTSFNNTPLIKNNNMLSNSRRASLTNNTKVEIDKNTNILRRPNIDSQVANTKGNQSKKGTNIAYSPKLLRETEARKKNQNKRNLENTSIMTYDSLSKPIKKANTMRQYVFNQNRIKDINIGNDDDNSDEEEMEEQ